MENKFYIKGNKKRAKEVIDLLRSKGGINTQRCSGEYEDKYYFMDKDNYISWTSDPVAKSVMEECFEELKLPEKEEKRFKFKPFDKVLMRDGDTCKWVATLYSNYDKDYAVHVTIADTYYNYCIPFEGNEALLGTKNNLK